MRQALSLTANREVVITSGHSIDYEQQTEYNFTVIATEASGNSSAQEVTVSVNNLDDTAPVITSTDSTVSIDENNDDLVVSLQQLMIVLIPAMA